MVPTNQRGQLTVKLIQDAFLRLLEEKDFLHITVSDICAEAEINRTTFYRYYDNQYTLLSTMEQALMDQLEAHEMSEYLFDPTPENVERAVEITADSFRCMQANLDAYRVLSTRIFPNIMDKFLDSRHKYIGPVVKRRFERDMRIAMETYVMGGGQAFIKQWLANDRREPPDLAARMLIGMSVGTIVAVRDSFSLEAMADEEAADPEI